MSDNKQQIVRLSESDVHTIIKNGVMNFINENSENEIFDGMRSYFGGKFNKAKNAVQNAGNKAGQAVRGAYNQAKDAVGKEYQQFKQSSELGSQMRQSKQAMARIKNAQATIQALMNDDIIDEEGYRAIIEALYQATQAHQTAYNDSQNQLNQMNR